MTKDEALTLALEALESSNKLINGQGTKFGLEGAMDGYYSVCFDIDGNNKLLNEAITAIKEALAQPLEPRNFCPCCGKRTADSTVIHPCTPPEGGHQ